MGKLVAFYFDTDKPEDFYSADMNAASAKVLALLTKKKFNYVGETEDPNKKEKKGKEYYLAQLKEEDTEEFNTLCKTSGWGKARSFAIAKIKEYGQGEK